MANRKTNQKYRSRRRYFSVPVQLKYAMLLSIVAGFVSLVMIFVMAWFVQRNYTLFLSDELGVSAQVIELIQQEQRLLEIALFVLFLFSITVMFACCLFVTRKLTGPVTALQRHLLLYSQGDWSRTFRLRRNDEFKELETIVNQMRDLHLRESRESQREVAQA